MRRACLIAAALAAFSGAARAEFTLHILHINDLHSRIEPITKFGSTCDAETDAKGDCFGGVARVAAKIAELRAALAGQPVLMLDAGDQFQGSLFYTTYKGAAEAEFMATIGFDAMALGNHEFDDGPAGLAAFLDRVSFPVVSGNIDVSAEPGLAGRVAPYVLLEVGGETVAIVSAVAADTPETSSPGPRIPFRDEVAALTETVERLRAEGRDKIIALTHVGLRKDMEIAAQVPGIDAIVGGHSHTLLSNTVDGAEPYPVTVSGEDGRAVPIVQAEAYSKYVGHLTLVFDDAGDVTSATGDTIVLDASVTPDPAIAARVAAMREPIEALMSEVVAETTAPVDGDRGSCRAGVCEMGVLVAEAMLDRVRGQGVQIAIQNGGGLRASIDAGEVTMGEVLTVLPFQNTLATFRIRGDHILAALENGLSQVEDGAGRFPQVAGMTYVWNPQAAPGSRVVSASVLTPEGPQPLDPQETYGVVSNDYMRRGGDGYAMFRDAAIDPYDFGPGLELVLADYLAANSPYAPTTDGRIATAE
ncbi:bifunctional metallophosphatase/5'-nucleotidase [Rubrimonas cliftonensis]|uniref:5'-nucleotidase n=1 Tax=Rubrimonas cliftonensis TaxID=89524 RepID=A0A1H3XEC6_9RHOB|nr:bifunctional metallophosphatase/5'-nucleotidase [Rubrimonas cliftonensis]SDZ96908.1 5'-nucleotidase [Rubrimonas cliftonensis]